MAHNMAHNMAHSTQIATPGAQFLVSSILGTSQAASSHASVVSPTSLSEQRIGNEETFEAFEKRIAISHVQNFSCVVPSTLAYEQRNGNEETCEAFERFAISHGTKVSR